MIVCAHELVVYLGFPFRFSFALGGGLTETIQDFNMCSFLGKPGPSKRKGKAREILPWIELNNSKC